MSQYRKTADLPDTLPVFPLPGALVFPRWDLPLNIFEPRYLNMFDDAMRGHRLIGMVQSMGGTRERPEIARVGCAGRITSYAETDDGRYLVTLTGICRFAVKQELAVTTPYRQVTPRWDAFAADLYPASEDGLPDRSELILSLRTYAATHGLQADWSAVEDAPMETLVHALAAGCPFPAPEKQALLEAVSLADRARTLIALMAMSAGGGDDGPVQ
ncbi:LON peptidase substrate-binding domain-containing protein [Hyphomonas sp.]|uniref:LON peptidase substrate-binding domain-containing protein n=1 Tax=Hyphomonas sp. TaxID=87 RepID=UPI000A3F9663|nr:LON peptidase substrate-binding domain-containing protein [Hyphomonas sp.]MBA4339093.1 peptidase S16 [Hyphomonas sp.]